MTKILIIEDDPIIANIYRSRLDKEGFQVEIAADGQSGFYRIHESHPEALLLDLMLPKMDGLQILRKIRAQKQFQNMPVIVFTNAFVPNMIQEAVQAGATHVFNKAALTPRQIIDAINQALFPGYVKPEAVAASGSAPVFPPSVPMPSPSRFQAPAAAAQSAPSVPAAPRQGIPMPSMYSAPVPSTSAKAASEPPKAPAPVTPVISTDSDAEFQAELLSSFLQTTPEHLAQLRKLLHEFLKNNNPELRVGHLTELYRKVHSITSNAAVVGLQNIAQMCAALEALLRELSEKPKNITASTLRSVTHAIDFLGVLFEKGSGPYLLDAASIRILVVDDEIISRRAVIYALEKGSLKSEAMDDPVAASKVLAEKSYDLIVLDVDMPAMNGFELCSKLRTYPCNQTTPVIFVTGLTDFESRAQSSLSGGNDLIAKPFLFIELTVKALIYVLKGRLGGARPA
jgi:DNA-binding response OmpR family regulator/HPt (histidine-containing phosphotransfer) domain-containing protein